MSEMRSTILTLAAAFVAVGGYAALAQTAPDAGPDRSQDIAWMNGQQAYLAGLDAADGWQGPLASGFGWHLVHLRSREQGAVPPLADIRKRVEDDWRGATMSTRSEAAYRLLRGADRVEIAE